MDYREVEKLIIRNGWILVRTLGSVRQYRKPGCEHAVVVACSGGRLSFDVVENLEKITGLSLWR